MFEYRAQIFDAAGNDGRRCYDVFLVTAETPAH
jgi:hypothetical protein